MRRAYPAFLRPDAVSFIVIGIYRDIQLFLVKADPFGVRQELPCKMNGFLLEIIADGKIPQHLKERVVARRPSHILDIVGPNGLLRVGDAVAFRLLRAVKILFQCSDARIDPKQSRIIVRNERCAWFDHVAVFTEILQEHLPYLIAGQLFHASFLLTIKKRPLSRNVKHYAVPS